MSTAVVSDLHTVVASEYNAEAKRTGVIATSNEQSTPLHQQNGKLADVSGANEDSGVVPRHKEIIFVLGGPGSGKGTQCERLVKQFHMAWFSAGDLLRAHCQSGTADGNMVAAMIQNGQIVPSEVTVGLLRQAVSGTSCRQVLIDGFPRNMENRQAFETVFGYDCSLVLFFDCPEAVLEQRLLARNQGRVDDNLETIKKRFKVFINQSLPVIEHYERLGKVKRVDTNRSVEEIFAELSQVFSGPLTPKPEYN